jgi:hypothetical protein
MIDLDSELLLGETVDPCAFADHNVSRVLASLYDTGPGRLFSQIAQNTVDDIALNTACAHYYTTIIPPLGVHPAFFSKKARSSALINGF